MKSNILFFIKLIVSFLPFVLFVFLNGKANVKKEVRSRQYIMPVAAVVYSVILLVFLKQLSEIALQLFLKSAELFDKIKLAGVGRYIRKLVTSWGIYLTLVLFNTFALFAYVFLKRILTLIIGRVKVRKNTLVGSIVGLFYSYNEHDDKWYIREHYGQARTFIKAVYYGSCFVSGLALLISCGLCMNHLVSAPFYPVFAVIIIGEAAFFIDGLKEGEESSSLSMKADNSQHIAMYPLLRKPLKELFGDKLAAEGTTVNEDDAAGSTVEDILADLEQNCGHIGRNYALFIRDKKEGGLKPDMDYLRCGYELAAGKSLLFNTPFYDKLTPYVFYAINRALLTGGKVLVVLGRHGTEDDLYQWCGKGMQTVSNVSGLWKTDVLSGGKSGEEDFPDIGIISRSGVHDLDIHKNNLPFLKQVKFVVIVEPSRLVATAQIGLNLLIKCCGQEHPITFCFFDRNCDGLVDSLSHILMTNITEVSATEYPHGMSSYMYWTADDDYLQHRILPGVSRYLGMGTELSMVALKNQVENTVWYGGEVFPVRDVRWIAKQYYHDLLDYAQLPANQETFDRYFQTSFNMCNEKVRDYSFITVEDDRNNLFETRRNFASISKKQGFVNVISSDYMLREYMSDNPEIFTADAKAIPYITADYARTRRNAILTICLLLCVDSVQEETLRRQMEMLNLDSDDPVREIWNEICVIFCGDTEKALDENGAPVLEVLGSNGEKIRFEKDSTILFKREYCIGSGKFESVYKIENTDFADIILDDLQNASYIAEQESKDVYIGTELKGHVYQKYMPGQFFTLNGKYYEMVSTTADNRILVRRASEHIGGRLVYRQVRNYTIHHIEDDCAMGTLKSINSVDIHYQFADFSVETPGYWKLQAYNDFDYGTLVMVNGVPARDYHHKQILKFDFSKLGDSFTDSVRMTLTNLLNESFVTLFADNQPFISAITPGKYSAPMTYGLALDESVGTSDKCIYIMEDSQLDIGLLIAVERNADRIFQIIADYLSWNEERIEESLRRQNEPAEETKPIPFDAYAGGEKKEKVGFFGKIGKWFKNLFGKIKQKISKARKKAPEDKEKTKAELEAERCASDAEEAGADAGSGGADDPALAVEGAEADSGAGESPKTIADADTGESAPAADGEALTPRQRRRAAKAAAKAEKAMKKQQLKMQKKQDKLQKRRQRSSDKQKEDAAEAEDVPASNEAGDIPESLAAPQTQDEDEVSENGQAQRPDD